MTNGFDIDDLKKFLPKLEQLASADEIEDIQQRATLAGANTMVEYIRAALIKNVPKATTHNPKYKDTIADAVRFTKMKAFSGKRMVHALGTRETGSGTYRAAFFDSNMKDRYQKTYNDKKLKKKRFLGHINPTGFFNEGVTSGTQATIDRMQQSVLNYIKQIKLI